MPRSSSEQAADCNLTSATRKPRRRLSFSSDAPASGAVSAHQSFNLRGSKAKAASIQTGPGKNYPTHPVKNDNSDNLNQLKDGHNDNEMVVTTSTGRRGSQANDQSAMEERLSLLERRFEELITQTTDQGRHVEQLRANMSRMQLLLDTIQESTTAIVAGQAAQTRANQEILDAIRSPVSREGQGVLMDGPNNLTEEVAALVSRQVDTELKKQSLNGRSRGSTAATINDDLPEPPSQNPGETIDQWLYRAENWGRIMKAQERRRAFAERASISEVRPSYAERLAMARSELNRVNDSENLVTNPGFDQAVQLLRESRLQLPADDEQTNSDGEVQLVAASGPFVEIEAAVMYLAIKGLPYKQVKASFKELGISPELVLGMAYVGTMYLELIVVETARDALINIFGRVGIKAQAADMQMPTSENIRQRILRLKRLEAVTRGPTARLWYAKEANRCIAILRGDGVSRSGHKRTHEGPDNGGHSFRRNSGSGSPRGSRER